jgi:putative DNA primase/helicase
VTAADLAEYFPGAKRIAGDLWAAPCPTHPDKNPSLKWKDHGDKVLLNCYATSACRTEDILAAVGLTMADLFHQPRPRLEDRIIATYDYRDLAGQLVYQTVRLQPKDFRQRRPDGQGGWIWNLDGVERLCYRLNELADAGADVLPTTVFFVEGEKDADRLWSLDVRATTTPMGAGYWRERFAEQLKAAGVRVLVILPDNDDPGRKHAEQVARSCHALGIEVFVVTLPGLPDKGDVADWLDEGHTLSDLLTVISPADRWTPDDGPPVLGAGRIERKSSGAEAQEPGGERDQPADGPALQKLSTIPRRAIEWLWRPYLALGKITQLSGDPDQGKSFVMDDLFARITAGGRWPTGELIGEPSPVVIVSAEDDAGDTIRPRIEEAGGNPELVYILDGRYRGGHLEEFVLNQIDLLTEVVGATKARIFGFDPYSAFLGRDTDEWKNAAVRAFLAPLKRFIEAHRVAALLITHFNKASQAKDIYRVQGSIAHVAAPRICYAVLRGLEDERDVRYLCKVKLNIALAPPPLAFRFSQPPGPDDVPTILWEPARVAKHSVKEMFAGEAPAPPARTDTPRAAEERTKLAIAKHRLVEWLAAVPMTVEALTAAGKAHGISWRTFVRAKDDLSADPATTITTQRATIPGPWFWRLPATPWPPSVPNAESISPQLASLASLEEPPRKSTKNPRTSSKRAKDANL